MKSAYDLFSISNPEAAVILSTCSDVPGLEFCTTAKGETNLKDLRYEDERYVYDQKGAFDSTFAWRQQFQLFKVDIVTVFGVGLGWEWAALEPWLAGDSRRELVFLEDDLAMLYRFLELPIAEKILSHPQTAVYYIDGEATGKRIFEILSWASYQKKTITVATRYYQTYRPQIVEKITKKLQVQATELSGTVDEFYSFGAVQFRSFFRNIQTFQKARVGSDLFSQFSGIPAIVVGAGPSLEQSLPYLREVQDKAILISGGTATNILLEAGIRPHFCAAVDPNPIQYLRLKQIQPFMIPMFYQSRLLPEGIRAYEGELLYMRGGNGQPLVEWFDEQLGLSGPIIDGGHSVANMIVEIAHSMGCSPILMVGYDLSYPSGAMYPSVVKEALSSYERSIEKEVRKGSCSATSNSGTEVATEDKWLIEAAWLHRYLEEHPDMTLYNTSFEGLAIGSVPYESFQNLQKQFLTKSYPLDAYVHKAIMEARKTPFSLEAISSSLGTLAKSIQSCTNLVEALAIQQDALLEHELQENVAFDAYLYLYNKMFEKKIEMARLFKEVHVQDPDQREAFERAMNQEKMKFFVQGLKALSRRICEYVSQAACEGMFMPNSQPLRDLEEKSTPKCLLGNL